jgi:predicted nucleic acid-binding protein
MTSPICVDSGIALKLVLNEPDSSKAATLWRTWLSSNKRLVAPPLFPIEITAVLRKHVHRGLITQPYGETALRKALNFNVSLVSYPDLHLHAYELATQFNRPTAYDAHYLAVARWLKCDFWTADERLYNAVHSLAPWVRGLGTYTIDSY